MRPMVLALIFCTLSFHSGAQTRIPETATLDFPAIWQGAGPQARLGALRVAELDARRRLAERVYGHYIQAETRSLDFVLSLDVIENAVDVSMRGAAPLGAPKYTQAGVVYVVYGVNIRDLVSRDKPEEPQAGSVGVAGPQDRWIAVIGNGALPGSPGLALLRAKRAAELDGFRKMAERLGDAWLTSHSSAHHSSLTGDRMRTTIQRNLKGLQPVAIVYADDGSCQVTLKLTATAAVNTIARSVRPLLKMGETWPSSNVMTPAESFTVIGYGAPASGISNNAQ